MKQKDRLSGSFFKGKTKKSLLFACSALLLLSQGGCSNTGNETDQNSEQATDQTRENVSKSAVILLREAVSEHFLNPANTGYSDTLARTLVAGDLSLVKRKKDALKHAADPAAYLSDENCSWNMNVLEKEPEIMTDSNGNVHLSFCLKKDLAYSDGESVLAADYLLMPLLSENGCVDANSGIAGSGLLDAFVYRYTTQKDQIGYSTAHMQPFRGLRLTGENTFELVVTKAAVDAGVAYWAFSDLSPVPTHIFLDGYELLDDGHGVFLPSAVAMEELFTKVSSYGTDYVGNGPFVIDHVQEDGTVYLKKNDRYQGEKTLLDDYETAILVMESPDDATKTFGEEYDLYSVTSDESAESVELPAQIVLIGPGDVILSGKDNQIVSVASQSAKDEKDEETAEQQSEEEASEVTDLEDEESTGEEAQPEDSKTDEDNETEDLSVWEDEAGEDESEEESEVEGDLDATDDVEGEESTQSHEKPNETKPSMEDENHSNSKKDLSDKDKIKAIKKEFASMGADQLLYTLLALHTKGYTADDSYETMSEEVKAAVLENACKRFEKLGFDVAVDGNAYKSGTRYRETAFGKDAAMIPLCVTVVIPANAEYEAEAIFDRQALEQYGITIDYEFANGYETALCSLQSNDYACFEALAQSDVYGGAVQHFLEQYGRSNQQMCEYSIGCESPLDLIKAVE